MTRGRKVLLVACLVLLNVGLFALLEWGASFLVGRPGASSQSTRIFNAANGRDADFVVQYDERLGYRMTPKNADASRFEDSAGKVVPVAKEPGVYRIVCLGGSTTYGVGADKTNSFPAQLETLLGRVYGGCQVRFEVLNCGVMGYHSWHSRIRFEAEIAALHPDLVLVMDAVNDLVASTVADDSPDFASEKDKLLRLTNAGDKAGAEAGLLSRANRFLEAHSNLYALARQTAARFAGAGRQGAGTPDDAIFRKKIELFGYRDNMKALIRLAGRDGADTALIDYPWLAVAEPPAAAPKVLAEASTPLYRFGKAYFPETNAAVAGEGGATVIQPQPAFDAAVSADASRAGEIYFDEIHLTKYGNQLLAREVLAGLPAVPSFARATAGCAPADRDAQVANAVKLDDPRVHFKNGWLRPGETALSLAMAATDNIVIGDDADYPGHAVVRPADPSRPGSLRLRAREAFAPAPMAHTRYPAYWFPRVSCAADRVEVVAGGRTVFSLAGPDPCRFTDVSGRFGVDLPALATGDVVEVRLFGHAQAWLTDGGLFFTGDVTPPGY